MDLNQKFVQLHQSLMHLAHADGFIDRDREQKLQKILPTCSKLLQAERVSVWALREKGACVECLQLYSAATDSFETGTRLYQQDFPRYFEEISQSKLINADDACLDPRTSEFAGSYLEPLGISSLLDAPLFFSGKLYGVLCIEHTGPARQWDIAEMSFASSVADTISLFNEHDAWLHTKDALQFQEQTDSLTSLENRSFFQQRIERDLERTESTAHIQALAIFGIDFFTGVNDTYGPTSADQVLMTLATRFEKLCYQKGGYAARLGADLFGFWLPNISSDTELMDFLQHIQVEANKPVSLGRKDLIEIRGSTGVFTNLQNQQSDDPIRCAEIALQKAKDQSKGSVVFFSPDWRNDLQTQKNLEAEIIQAFEKQEFFPVYQPIVDTSDGSTAGLEALVRWAHPKRGVLSPFYFLPAVTKMGLMSNLGSVMLQTVCRDVNALLRERQNLQWVSVNLAAEQLYNSSLTAEIQKLLAEYELPSSILELEIVEELIGQDSDMVRSQLTTLSEIGVRLSIDDFGTGYSSLSRLKHLPVTKLKIDKSFVDGLPNAEDDQCIARSIIGLAKGMGLDLVAEGVETEQQKSWLKQHGCEYLQGYLFSPPVEFDALMQLQQQWGMEDQSKERFTISRYHRVIEIVVSGQWETSTVEDLFNTLEGFSNHLNGQPWATLIDASAWIPGSSAVQKLIQQKSEQLPAVGLHREAYILGDNDVANYQIELMAPKAEQYQRYLFKDRLAAIDWLIEEGFPLQ